MATPPVTRTDQELTTRLRERTGFATLCHVATCTSTMDLAAADPVDTPAVFWADHQTAGRGRQQRPWHDAPGLDLAVTFRVRPHLPVPVALPAVVPLCVLETLAAAGQAKGHDLPLRLKWPNDVLLGGRKIAGVLIDAATARPGIYLIGIGININTAAPPDEVAAIATSLHRATGRAHDRGELLLELATRLDVSLRQLAAGDHASFEARYREHLGLLGRPVILKSGAVTRGVLAQLDFTRGLTLADGRTFALGQVQELRAQ